MILKADKLARLLEEGRSEDAEDPLVITPAIDTEGMKATQNASIDLRLGSWFLSLRHSRASVLDIGKPNEQQPGEQALIKNHFVRFGEKFILHPRCFVLGSTLEWIRLPRNLAGYVTSRSSWGRRGLIIATATGVHPGFTGCLTLELFNAGEVPIALRPGMAISQFFIHSVESLEGNLPAIHGSNLSCWRKPRLGEVKPDVNALRLMNGGHPNTSS